MRLFRNVVVALTASLALVACTKDKSAISSDDMVIGSDKAPITVVEYASVACPHCATFNNQVFPAFKELYIDTGKVRWIAREHITGDPTMATAGFLIARCADKDKYFHVTDAIYRDQQGIYSNLRQGLLNVAMSAGMTEQQFTKCLDDQDAIKAMNDRILKTTTADKITGTPTFLVDGKVIGNGEISLEALEKAIIEATGGAASPLKK